MNAKNVIHVRFGPLGGRMTPEERALDLCEIGLRIEAEEPYRAKSIFQQALFLWPDCACAHVMLGNLVLRDRMSELARFHYTEALRVDPSCFVAAFNLGSLAYQDRDFVESKKWLVYASKLQHLADELEKEALETMLDDVNQVMVKKRRKR